MTEFTPISASIGGLLIGGSAALLLLLNGRIAGISGILGSLLQPRQNDIPWRLGSGLNQHQNAMTVASATADAKFAASLS